MLAAPQHRPRPLPLFLALLRSMTDGEPARARAALAGLKAYQQAEREPEPAPAPAIAEARGAMLRDYGGPGSGSGTGLPPVIFIPSLINPPTVLDISGRSLLRWLAARDARCCLDWGWPGEDRHKLDVAAMSSQTRCRCCLVASRRLVGYASAGRWRSPPQRRGASVATIAAPCISAAFRTRTGRFLNWRGAGPRRHSAYCRGGCKPLLEPRSRGTVASSGVRRDER